MTELTLTHPQQGGRHFCTFRLDGRLYGVELAAVREVSTGLAITPVPHAPPEIRGLANLRSRIYLVLDIRPILGLNLTPPTSDSRLVVLKDHVADNLGLLADAGGDIVNLPSTAVETVTQATDPAASEKNPSLVTEIGKLPQELLMIIDPVRMTEHVKRLMV